MITHYPELKKLIKSDSRSGAALLPTASISREYYTVLFFLFLSLILFFTDVCSVLRDTLQNVVQLPHGV